jgi:integrase
MARRRRGQFPEPKKENGQWKIRYWTDQAQPDGSIRRVRKTKCLGLTDQMTLTEARKEASRFLQPINDVEEGTEHTGKTMEQLIARWRKAVKPAFKLSTQLSYEWALKRIGAAVAKSPLAAISKAEVQAFLTTAGRALSSESVRDLRARLRGVLSVAEEWGWIRPGANPARGELRLPPRELARPRRVLSPVEFQRLLIALRQPYGTIVLLAVLAGLGRGELAALRWGDIRPGEIVIDEAVYNGQLGSPKTPKSKREVSIGPMTQQAIEQWRKMARFKGPNDFMFGIRTNTPIDLHTAVARHIKPAALRIGISAISWHDLRHTYTTWGRRAGIKAETMRDQLRHSSVLMTLDVYSHAQDRVGEAKLIENYAWNDEAHRVV